MPNDCPQRTPIQFPVVRNHNLGEGFIPAQDHVAAFLALEDEPGSTFLRNRQAILLQCRNVAEDSLLYVLDRFFSGTTLANATGKAGALSDPVTVFARVENDLPHQSSL